ncbi:MAG: Spx/MgsR family RNA polymerase-binding regulatory protein [Runella sp.]
MLTIYGIPNCDTIKKTLHALKERQIPFVFHDYKKNGIGMEQLEKWLQQTPLDTLINRAGTTFKKLSDDDKNALANRASALSILMDKPSIIKRPIIEKEGQIVMIGWKPEVLDTL